VLATLRARRHFVLTFHNAPLGEIVKDITRISGVHLSVSKKVAQKTLSLDVRGDLTPIEVFHRLNRTGNTYAVVERSGVVSVLSVEDYRKLVKATGGKVGVPLPVPDYYPQIEFRMLAYSGKGGLEVDLPAEKKRLLAWLEKGTNRQQILEAPHRIAGYLGLAAERGGRLSKDFLWIPYRIESRGRGAFGYSNTFGHAAATLALFSPERLMAGPKTESDYLVEFLAVNMKERAFTTMDLIPRSLAKSKAAIGLTLLYEIKEPSAAAYSDLTARNIRRGMAVILDGYLISAPVIMSRIPGSGMVSGLSETKIDRIVKALKR
jgi:SecDF, P1 head subdomain